MNKLKLTYAGMLMLFLLMGCTSQQEKREKRLNEYARTTERNLNRLEDHIKTGNISNSFILSKYASEVKQQRPELSDLIDEIAKDSTSKGPIFQGLKLRLTDAISDILIASQGNDERFREVNNEFVAINSATKSHLYGQMLADPINVLADLSNGVLPRVEALSKNAEEKIDGVSDSGAGTQLVGNPHYGSWQNGSGGSFWAWYGKYALFSSLFNRSIYYDRWSNRRGYSYYHDYGRSTYSSPKQMKNQRSIEAKTKKKFTSQGKRFESPYAKKRATTTKISSQRSNQFSSKSSSIGSNKATRKSVYSNTRSSSYSSSRSSFGGK
jgi:hypothetical protein